MEPVKKFPAAVPSGGHILGQPFTIANLSIPVNATFTCNCAQPPSDLPIRLSEPVTCPACQKKYVVAFNPQTGQIMVAMTAAEPKVES